MFWWAPIWVHMWSYGAGGQGVREIPAKPTPSVTQEPLQIETNHYFCCDPSTNAFRITLGWAINIWGGGSQDTGQPRHSQSVFPVSNPPVINASLTSAPSSSRLVKTQVITAVGTENNEYGYAEKLNLANSLGMWGKVWGEPAAELMFSCKLAFHNSNLKVRGYFINILYLRLSKLMYNAGFALLQ